MICFFVTQGMDVCLIPANQHVNSVSRVRYTQTRHHCAHHLPAWKDYLQIEKDYMYLQPEKD